MILLEWARKWGVSLQAIHDLERQMGARPELPAVVVRGSEAGVQADIRLEAAQAGGILWRNNVGAAQDKDGNFFRFGLCNDSKAVGKVYKSSDLIGIKPVVITQNHVGWKIGQFIAREIKRPNWNYTATARERAQLRFIELVLSMGGDACFARGRGTL